MIDIKQAIKSENAKSTIEKDWKCRGFKCVVLLVRQSHRCGYIAIPKNHVAFELNYDDIPVNVHGGLTFGSFELNGIPKNKNIFWFGFDTAHSGDRTSYESEGHLWTTKEVARECENMAIQFKKMTLRDLIKRKLEYMPNWFKDNIIIKVK